MKLSTIEIQVAIKVIDKKKAKEDAYVSKNMRREGKLLQMIIHPNIIQLYELMETENRLVRRFWPLVRLFHHFV